MNSSVSNAGTVVCCIDGRIQAPVTEFLRNAWQTPCIDVITEIAPEKILCEAKDRNTLRHLHEKIATSLAPQIPKRLALAAHEDCESNPVSDETRISMLRRAVAALADTHRDVVVLGVWVDGSGKANMV